MLTLADLVCTEQKRIGFKERNMRRNQHGFTLLELMIMVVLVGILAGLAHTSFTTYVERAKVAKAIGDIGKIHIAIQNFLLSENRGYPANLAEVGLDDLRDPWGNPYQYLVVDGLNNNGAVRKDKNLVPVNRYYDIYSMGNDGVTSTPFTSNLGQDDIVLAGDGGYFGLAKDH